MPNRTRVQAAAPIAIGVRRLENSIDDTLIDTNELMACMLRARQDAKVSADFGHDALEEVFNAIDGLFIARRATLRTHVALQSCRIRLGLPEVADGGKIPMRSDPGGIHTEQQQPMMFSA